MIEKADFSDLAQISEIYEAIHDEEAAGHLTTGWIRGVYPTAETARAAYDRGDLYVVRENGNVVAAAIINRIQPPGYESGTWTIPAVPEEVLVLHTLVVDPKESGKGYGRAMIRAYEQMASQDGSRALRMDTNARNVQARAIYAHLGYREAGIIPTEFNGIPDVYLVLLEKNPPDQDVKTA